MINTPHIQFSPIMATLLEYGQARLETDFTDYAAELADDLRELLADGADVAQVQQDLASLTDALAAACAFWSAAPQLVLESDGADWHEAVSMLHVFDLTSHLEQALFHLRDHLPASLYDTLNAASDTLTVTLDGFLNDTPEVSLLRLTPLNSYRRWKLEALPAAVQDLYPWYAAWSDLPDTLLVELAENWAAVCAADFTALALPESCPPPVLIDELHADATLRQTIMHHHRERCALRTALQQARDQRLWYLGEEASFDYPLPEGLEEKGLVRLAVKVLDPTASRAEKLAQVFWVAFCSTGLTNAQRLGCFQWVLNRLDGPAEASETSVHLNLLHKLQQWLDDAVAGDVFAGAVYQSWHDRLLVLAAEEPNYAGDLAPVQLTNRISAVQIECDRGVPVPDLGALIHSAWSAFKEWFAPFQSDQTQPVYAGEAPESDAVAHEISTADLPTQLTIEALDGYIELPGLTGEWRSIVEQSVVCLAHGVVWNAAGERREIEGGVGFATERFLEIEDQFNGQPVQNILLMLIFDEAVRDEAIAGLRAWVDNPQTALPRLKKIVYLYYAAAG